MTVSSSTAPQTILVVAGDGRTVPLSRTVTLKPGGAAVPVSPSDPFIYRLLRDGDLVEAPAPAPAPAAAPAPGAATALQQADAALHAAEAALAAAEAGDTTPTTSTGI